MEWRTGLKWDRLEGGRDIGRGFEAIEGHSVDR